MSLNKGITAEPCRPYAFRSASPDVPHSQGEAIVSTRHYGSIMLAFYPASFLYSASFLFDSINRSISELLIHVLVNR
jgi:hypothetical protein